MIELRPGLLIDSEKLIQLCERHNVHWIALFGSAITDNFNETSDVDFLVEFLPTRAVGMLEIANFEFELSDLLNKREVEIRTPKSLSPLFRDDVLMNAQHLYEAA